MDLNTKYKTLQRNLGKLNNLLVAYSGGVDSAFLVHVAQNVLGDKLLAVTADSETFPERELSFAKRFAKEKGIRHLIIQSEELSVEGFAQNPMNRCYLCKTELFGKIVKVAKEHGIEHIAEGSNTDDVGDYRPGMAAVSEMGILSPLREAGLSKEDIRRLSKEEGLSTWNKPSFACLSSRFPYGQKITREKLQAIDNAEQFLFEMGFAQVRVRHHGEVARIELHPGEIDRVFSENRQEEIYKYFKKLGFTYTAVDLKGYRTGSMNEEKI